MYRAIKDTGTVLEKQEKREVLEKDTFPAITGHRHFGRISDWLRRHENRNLPRDQAALAYAIGVSKNAVKCYLYRRRRSVKEKLMTLPDLRNDRIVLVDVMGEEYRGSDLDNYEFLIDRFSLRVTIQAVSQKRRTKPIFAIPSVRDFIRAVKLTLR